MFRLFQLDIPREEFNAVNRLGWTEAMSQFPRIEAHMALSTGGSDAYVTEYDQYFKHVADIDVNDPEKAFLVHNNPHGRTDLDWLVVRYGPQHSMSVGDILVGEYGEVLMVDNSGFTQLMSSHLGADVVEAA